MRAEYGCAAVFRGYALDALGSEAMITGICLSGCKTALFVLFKACRVKVIHDLYGQHAALLRYGYAHRPLVLRELLRALYGIVQRVAKHGIKIHRVDKRCLGAVCYAGKCYALDLACPALFCEQHIERLALRVHGGVIIVYDPAHLFHGLRPLRVAGKPKRLQLSLQVMALDVYELYVLSGHLILLFLLSQHCLQHIPVRMHFAEPEEAELDDEVYDIQNYEHYKCHVVYVRAVRKIVKERDEEVVDYGKCNKQNDIEGCAEIFVEILRIVFCPAH